MTIERRHQTLALLLAAGLGLAAIPLAKAELLRSVIIGTLLLVAVGPLVVGAVQVALGVRSGADLLHVWWRFAVLLSLAAAVAAIVLS